MRPASTVNTGELIGSRCMGFGKCKDLELTQSTLPLLKLDTVVLAL